MTVQYIIPIRLNTPQVIGPYTFVDQDGVVIPLDDYVSCMLELKKQGVIYDSIASVILTPASEGKVKLASYTFVAQGIWDLQFYVTDGSGNRVFGEPLQIRVVKNVEDLSLSELAKY